MQADWALRDPHGKTLSSGSQTLKAAAAATTDGSVSAMSRLLGKLGQSIAAKAALCSPPV